MNRTSIEGEIVHRHEPCRLCGSTEGLKIAELDFWDLQHADFIQCPSCRLIQLDPMLTDRNTATGCHAYYILETSETSLHEQERNLVRNYRKGILFAHSLRRKGFRPSRILEFGPGSGYFAAGFQSVFPGCTVTVVDILDDVLANNRNVHGFETLKGSPEDIHLLEGRTFDLILARDILEHVSDIGRTLRNAHSLLEPGGLFHFLTPNGIEDVWGYYLNWYFLKKPSELLINHVNYFDGAGLLKYLGETGFAPVEYYTFQAGNALRGKGWKVSRKLSKPPSVSRSAEEMIRRKNDLPPGPSSKKEILLDHWVFRSEKQWLINIYCRSKHFELIRLDPRRNTGHEIYGVFRKK
jgi:SAM-dependent methyltransferase